MVQSKILAKYTNLFHYFGDKNDSTKLAKFGIKKKDIIAAEQIHGNKVYIVNNDKIKLVEGSDAMITNKPFTLGIRTADCLPIFFYDHKSKIIAVIHAGWKGLSTGIIKNAITKMKKLGSSTLDIIVSIGPHIQVCCYNVSEYRLKKFNLLSRSSVAQWRLNKWFLDLSKVALLQLNLSGIKNPNIEISDICTSCDKNYWSFRRDGEKSGRMVNIIGIIEN